jgi:glutamate racemase
MTEHPRIGIFDSGIGGFSVLKEIDKVTNGNILYFGDCARAPYGNKSPEIIVRYIKDILLSLKQKGVTHFVSACNSMSVLTTDAMLEECGISKDNYVDMTRAINAFIGLPYSSSVLVVGTQATIASGVYRDVLERRSHRVIDYSPTELAGAIERGVHESILREIILPIVLYAKEVDASHLLYACTHYPLVAQIFESVAEEVDWRGVFIDPSMYVALAVRLWNLEGEKIKIFETSLRTDAFQKHTAAFV